MMRIVVPVRNSPWIARCIKTLQNQTYGDFTCAVMEDDSDDDTPLVAMGAARGDTRFSVITAERPVGALQNIINGIAMHEGTPGDIIVTIDGDDWLAQDRSLETIRKVYRTKPETRLTFGQYWNYAGDTKGHCRPYPEEVQKARTYRTYHDWHVSQPRTFRRELWDKVHKVDLFNPMTNKPWEMAWDLAMMFPMMEMCTPEEIVCIEEVLYIYNNNHGNNDWAKDMALQGRLASAIRNMAKYPRVER